MMTRKEFCQYILIKAQQKFGKKMGDLDVYYAPEVGIALDYLGLVEDRSTSDHISNTPVFLFSTQDGKSISYKELLYLLPDDKTTVKEVKKEVEKNTSVLYSTEKELKEKVGDRKFYRILDATEGITVNELDTVIGYLNLMKEESKKTGEEKTEKEIEEKENLEEPLPP